MQLIITQERANQLSDDAKFLLQQLDIQVIVKYETDKA